jgi:hypothetical protein
MIMLASLAFGSNGNTSSRSTSFELISTFQYLIPYTQTLKMRIYFVIISQVYNRKTSCVIKQHENFANKATMNKM